jgi:hypothetical protein
MKTTALTVLALCSLAYYAHAGNAPSITLERLVPSQSRTLVKTGSHPNFGRRLQNVKEQSMFKVVSPSTLAEKYKGGVKHSEALFGIPKYGGEITQVMFYATPLANDTGCSSYDQHPEWSKADGFVLLVDRGDCHFTTKVRKAENLGAAAVVIADSVCLTGEPDCTCDGDEFSHPVKSGNSWQCAKGTCRKFTCSRYEYREPYMADDGSGANIGIPSYLVSYYDSMVFKRYINSAKWNDRGNQPSRAAPATVDAPMVVKLSWELPTPDGMPKWSLWTSSEDDNGAEFKQNFASSAQNLAPSSLFSPRYFVYDGARWRCLARCSNAAYTTSKSCASKGFVWTKSFCGSQCVNKGKFCAPDPDGAFNSNLEGRDIVKENLRQICLWYSVNQTTTGDHTEEQKWWNYVNRFSEECYDETTFTMEPATFEQCSWSTMTKIDPKLPDKVKMCMAKAAGDAQYAESMWDDNHENDVLARELEDRDDLSILTLPTVTVNSRIERGSTSAQAVMQTICSAYHSGKAPQICDHALHPMGVDGSYSVDYSVVIEDMSKDKFTDDVSSLLRGAIAFRAQVVKTSVSVRDSTDIESSNPMSLRVTFRVSNLVDAKEATTVANNLKEKVKDGFTIGYFDDNTNEVLEYDVKLDTDGSDPSVNTPPGEPSPGSSPGGVSAGWVVVIVLIVVGVMGTAGVVYYKKQQAAMRAEVRNILAEYMPLEEAPAYGPGSEGGASEADTARMI